LDLSDFTGAADLGAGLAAGEGLDLSRTLAGLGAGFGAVFLEMGLGGGDFLGEGFEALTGFFGEDFTAGLTGLPTDFFLGAGAGFLVFLAMMGVV
jgi:hypothetical protein